MRLKIGDDFLDTYGNEVIAQTYGVNEIGDISTRQGGFSNDFVIPLTAKNRSILDFPEDINSDSRNPYTKVQATLFDNGVPVASGYLRYQVVNDTNLQASFFSDNTAWYNLIKDKNLTDLELSAYDHDWDYDAINTAILADKDSGYTYPLIDYGEFADETSLDVFSDQMYPAMFVSTLLKQILIEIGWKAEGELLAVPLFKRMIIPFSASAFVHSNQWVTDNTYTDTIQSVQAIDSTGAEIIWATAASTDITIATETGSYTITTKLNVSLSSGGFFIDIRVNGSPVQAVGEIAAVTATDIIVTAENVDLIPGDVVTVFARVDSSPPLMSVNTSSTITITPNATMQRGSTIQMASVLPDISQADFIKYIAYLFGAVLQADPDSGTVTFNLFNSIKGNLINALDWSNKIDIGSIREVNFTELLDRYAIKSKMTYLEDDNDSELKAYKAETNKIFGEGQFDINNDHIDGENVIYEAPFSSMINITSFNNTMYIPQIRYVDGDDLLTIAPKIAILSENISVGDLSLDAYSELRLFNDPDEYHTSYHILTEIPFCWFVKTPFIEAIDEIPDTLAFDQVEFTAIGDPTKDRYLKDYELILNSMRYLKAYFHLTEIDISELDFTIPVYIDRFKAYFYISKINNYQGSKQVTEVELVKIVDDAIGNSAVWILADGTWNDSGVWDDTDVWID